MRPTETFRYLTIPNFQKIIDEDRISLRNFFLERIIISNMSLTHHFLLFFNNSVLSNVCKNTSKKAFKKKGPQSF